MASQILETCPFDKAHRIRKIALSRHLAKCTKNHPFSHMICCPFNVTHVIEPKNIKQHLEECTSTRIDERYTLRSKEIEGIIPLKMIENVKIAISDENWDEADYVYSYDPFKATEEKDVLRCPVGKSKAEKRKFRKAERLRFKNLNKNKCTSNVPKLKMFIETTIHSQQSTKVLLHDLLFPEHIGIHRLSIHDIDECLKNIGFHKLSIRDIDECLEDIQFHKLSVHDKDVHIDTLNFRNLKI